MQKKIDASIIITTYNRPHYLERAIKSCLSQNTVYNYEIIVIDDNGLHTAHQQQTETLVSQYLHQINYLPLATNSGACVARNHGIDHAKGKYIFFLDDDDEYLPSKVQNQVQFLENNIADYLIKFLHMLYIRKELYKLYYFLLNIFQL